MSLLAAFKAFFWALKNPKAFEQKTKKIEEKKPKPSYDHLRLLAMMQNNARFIDFIKEDISSYSDQEVGAVARDIHKECSKLLEDVVGIRVLSKDEEGSTLTIASHFDPQEISLIGNVKGSGPYKGILRHPGWKASKLSLPEGSQDLRKEILQASEVEIQ
jgi:hypothetical protein